MLQKGAWPAGHRPGGLLNDVFYALKGRNGGRGGQRIVSSHKTWETVTSQKEAPDTILQVLLREKCKTYLNADNIEKVI